MIRGKVRSACSICVLMYALFCSITGVFAPELVEIMGQKEMLDDKTIKYIRLELCGIFLKGMSKLFMIVLVLGKKSLCLNLILVVQLCTSIVSDLLFFS